MDVVQHYFRQLTSFLWTRRGTQSRILIVLFLLHLLRRLKARTSRKSVRKNVVLITGGASGIGRQMAIRFSRLGATLVLWDLDRQADALQRVSKEISSETGNNVFTFTVDVTDRERVKETAELVKKRVGPVDILINNAGIVSGKNIFSPDYDENLAEKTIAVNTTSHLWTIRAFCPDMINRKKGHLVTIASAAGLVGTCGLAEYCASKFGAVGLNEAVRREFKRYNYNVNTTVVCPFYINTGMFSGVRSPLIPMLDENYVADSIVNAVRENVEFLGLPSLVHYGVILLNGLLPIDILDFIFKQLKVSSTMDTFVGRPIKYK